MKRIVRFFTPLLLATFAVLSAESATMVFAQVPPSSTELAAYTGLHRAAHENDSQTIEKLLNGQPDLKAIDSTGRTAAHVAAHASADECLKLLVAAGVDINALDASGYTALAHAARHGQPGTVRLLIRRGASIDTALEAAGYPMGPFRLIDLIGLDVDLAIDKILFDDFWL